MTTNLLPYQLFATLSYVGLVIVNVLAGAGKIGKGSNAIISKENPTSFTPEGYAFSIWGLIFFLQALYIIYIWIPFGYGANELTSTIQDQHDLKVRLVKITSILMPIGWIFECVWQYAFSYEKFAIALPLIWFAFFAMLTNFVLVVGIFKQHEAESPFSSDDCKFGLCLSMSGHDIANYVCFLLSTSINAAWLSAASCIMLLVEINSRSTASTNVTIGLGISITLIGIVLTLWSRDVSYPLTLIWALVAIYLKQHDAYPEVGTTAIVAIIVLAVVALVGVPVSQLVHNRRETTTSFQEL